MARMALHWHQNRFRGCFLHVTTLCNAFGAEVYQNEWLFQFADIQCFLEKGKNMEITVAEVLTFCDNCDH